MCCKSHYVTLFVDRQSLCHPSKRLIGLFGYYLKWNWVRRKPHVSVCTGSVKEPFQDPTLNNSVSNGKRNRTAPDVFPFTIYCPSFSAARGWRLVSDTVQCCGSPDTPFPMLSRCEKAFEHFHRCDWVWPFLVIIFHVFLLRKRGNCLFSRRQDLRVGSFSSCFSSFCLEEEVRPLHNDEDWCIMDRVRSRICFILLELH